MAILKEKNNKLIPLADINHVILDRFNTEFTPRKKLYFSNSIITDDKENNTTIITGVGSETVVPFPILSDTVFQYNGLTQGPIITRVNPDYVTITGNTTGISSGTYSFIASLVDPDNTVWADRTVNNKTFSFTIYPVLLDFPTVDDVNCIYDGTSKSPLMYNFNASYMYKLGFNQTNAGVYTGTFKLVNPNYARWADGTIDDYQVKWEIKKAEQNITFSLNPVTFSNSIQSRDVNVDCQGELTISPECVSIAKPIVNGKVITFNCIKESNVTNTFTVKAAATSNYKATSAMIQVQGKYVDIPAWSTATDEEIIKVLDGYYSGKYSVDDIRTAWTIGDRRVISMKEMLASSTVYGSSWSVGERHHAQDVEMTIVDFDHDELMTPIGNITKGLITVAQQDILVDASSPLTGAAGSMNGENGYMDPSTGVNWSNCARRDWCNLCYYNAIDSDLLPHIKPVKKLIWDGSSIISINDLVFLPSEEEIFGTASKTNTGQGYIYKYYNLELNRYKRPKWNNSGTSSYYWCRSLKKNDTSKFSLVTYKGKSDTYAGTMALGIAPMYVL